jgi:hypothetical protein
MSWIENCKFPVNPVPKNKIAEFGQKMNDFWPKSGKDPVIFAVLGFQGWAERLLAEFQQGENPKPDHGNGVPIPPSDVDGDLAGFEALLREGRNHRPQKYDHPPQ